MTRFRYWLADLISGGELTRVNDQSTKSANSRYHITNRLQEVDNALAMCSEHRAALKSALRAIAAEAKPTSNATVRRMARIAQEALK